MSLLGLTNESIFDLACVCRLAWRGLSLYKRCGYLGSKGTYGGKVMRRTQ